MLSPVNIGRLWGDEGPEDDTEDDDVDMPGVGEREVVIQDDNPGPKRVRGQVERDRLKDSML